MNPADHYRAALERQTHAYLQAVRDASHWLPAHELLQDIGATASAGAQLAGLARAGCGLDCTVNCRLTGQCPDRSLPPPPAADAAPETEAA